MVRLSIFVPVAFLTMAGASSALAQSAEYRVDQLSTVSASRESLSDTRPADREAVDPGLNQIATTADRFVPSGPSAPRQSAPMRQLARSDDQSLAVAAPSAAAVDRCEAHDAGLAPAPAGVDCAAVLEAAAFARRTPEERLLAPSRNDAAAIQSTQTLNRRVVPNAEAVAQRLAIGLTANSPVAEAIAAGYAGRPPVADDGGEAGGGATPPPQGAD